MALIISLLDLTGCRVGSEIYARDNRTYGLTTLRVRHATINSGAMKLRFRGKHNKLFEVSCNDRRIAKHCQELPGQFLFQYEDDQGGVHPVRADDINDYLRDTTGVDITAKTFRTWEGSAQAASILAPLDPPAKDRERQSALKSVIEQVASSLGNTEAVARGSYVHPRIVELWGNGALARRWTSGPTRSKADVARDERRFLYVLEMDLPKHKRQPV